MQSVKMFINSGYRELLPRSDLVQGLEVETHAPSSVLLPNQLWVVIQANS